MTVIATTVISITRMKNATHIESTITKSAEIIQQLFYLITVYWQCDQTKINEMDDDFTANGYLGDSRWWVDFSAPKKKKGKSLLQAQDE